MAATKAKMDADIAEASAKAKACPYVEMMLSNASIAITKCWMMQLRSFQMVPYFHHDLV